MNVLLNEIELKGIYTYEKGAVSDLSNANNLGYALGASSASDNQFDKELKSLVKAGILTKTYDFTEGGYREGLYNFAGNQAQVSFFGKDHIGLSLFFNY